MQAVAQLPPVDAEADPSVDHIITLICQVPPPLRSRCPSWHMHGAPTNIRKLQMALMALLCLPIE